VKFVDGKQGKGGKLTLSVEERAGGGKMQEEGVNLAGRNIKSDKKRRRSGKTKGKRETNISTGDKSLKQGGSFC